MKRTNIKRAVKATAESAITRRAVQTTERLLINAKEVCERLGGISRAQLSKWTHNPKMNFPKRAQFGDFGRGRANFWLASEIDEWAINYVKEHAGQYKQHPAKSTAAA